MVQLLTCLRHFSLQTTLATAVDEAPVELQKNASNGGQRTNIYMASISFLQVAPYSYTYWILLHLAVLWVALLFHLQDFQCEGLSKWWPLLIVSCVNLPFCGLNKHQFKDDPKKDFQIETKSKKKKDCSAYMPKNWHLPGSAECPPVSLQPLGPARWDVARALAPGSQFAPLRWPNAGRGHPSTEQPETNIHQSVSTRLITNYQFDKNMINL